MPERQAESVKVVKLNADECRGPKYELIDLESVGGALN